MEQWKVVLGVTIKIPKHDSEGAPYVAQKVFQLNLTEGDVPKFLTEISEPESEIHYVNIVFRRGETTISFADILSMPVNVYEGTNSPPLTLEQTRQRIREMAVIFAQRAWALSDSQKDVIEEQYEGR